MPKIKQLVITFEDNEIEPFTQADIENFQTIAEELLGDYDIEITKVEVKDVDET